MEEKARRAPRRKMGHKMIRFQMATEEDGAKQSRPQEPTLEEILLPRLESLIDKVGHGGCNGLYEKVMEGVEKPLIKLVLKRTGGNQVRASEILGINRNTLRRKIQKLKIRSR